MPEMAGAFVPQCKQSCATQSHCSNEAAIESAFKSCLAMSACDAFHSCLDTLPDCQGGTGTGAGGSGAAGSSGTGGPGGTDGGSTGAAGSGGGAQTCAVCAKADACCAALPDGGMCSLESSCNMAASGDQASIASSCQALLSIVGAMADAPAACK